MGAEYKIGVVAAVAAALTWSLNFVAPFFIGDYSLGDLAATRFIFSGMIGSLILYRYRELCKKLTARDWIVTAGLGFIGYVGYFITVMMAVVYAGPVIPPAFLGLVPIALAIAGNVYSTTISWKVLRLPLITALTGLLLVNANSLTQSTGDWNALHILGMCSAIAAVALWTWFGIANQRALSRRPGTNAWVWTAMMMISGSIETLIFIPVGQSLGLFNAPGLGFGSTAFLHLYLPAFVLAVIASVGGAWAWTVASQRLPMALAGQLLTTEMVFATAFGLLIHSRLPGLLELLGIALILVGVVKAIGAFHNTARSALNGTEQHPHFLPARRGTDARGS